MGDMKGYVTLKTCQVAVRTRREELKRAKASGWHPDIIQSHANMLEYAKLAVLGKKVDTYAKLEQKRIEKGLRDAGMERGE